MKIEGELQSLICLEVKNMTTKNNAPITGSAIFSLDMGPIL